MKVKDGFSLRTVGKQAIVVPLGVQTVDFQCLISLNDTGAFLWEALQEEKTAEELVTALLEEYEVSEETARNDVEAFAEKLRQADLLA